MEVWRDIPDYKGYYKVSNYGNVKSLITNKVLKPQNINNYRNVTLCKDANKKSYGIHRLVFWAFKGTLSDLKNHIDHKDNNKSNNRLGNLQMLSPRDNTKKDYPNPSNMGFGVTKVRNKFRARITINGKCIHLGYFKTKEEARKEYLKRLKDEQD